MTDLRIAAQQALEAIEDMDGYRKDIDEAITALRAALAQPDVPEGLVPELVSWVVLQKTADEIVRSKSLWKRFIDGTPLENDISCWMADFAEQFSSPPPARVPLTHENIAPVRRYLADHGIYLSDETTKALIEAAHGIGGGK